MKEYLLHLFHNIRISDLFDVAIISVLSYFVLIWLKKTASRFVFIGIIILGFIYMMARFFHMYLTEYVLQGFFAILFIAMLIIFQEDLRRFFERLAIWRPLRNQKHAISPDIATLASAVIGLARKRYGALIIIRGKDYLDRHLEGGTEVDGKISAALIESIFDPHSSGHDGALILEGARISKFGCHLPLSTNTPKVINVGLRHTAALGLAERSDALCIVVSEERGSISIAQHGSIHRLKAPEDLTKELEEFQGMKQPPQVKKLRPRWLRENLWEKGIALMLACALWMAFGYQTEIIRRDFVVPVEYRNLPANWIIENQHPKEATISLRGSKQAFDLLHKDTPKLTVDMSGIREGKQGILLSQNMVVHPSNLTVVGIQPEELSLTAHQMAPYDIPVKVDTTGTLPEGLTLKHIEVSPEFVNVMTQRKSALDLQIRTEPISLASIKETTKFTPKLLLPPTMEFTEKKAPLVTVTITVEGEIPPQQEEKSEEK